MQKLITFVAALLIAAPALAKPLDKPAGIRVKDKLTFITNSHPLDPAYEAIVRAIMRVNSYLKEPVIELAILPVPAYMHAHPLVSSITVASQYALTNILGLFTPNVLGMAGLFPNPLKQTDGLIGKVWLRDHYETPHMRDYVTEHELLHAIGVPHVADPEDLMYPQYVKTAKVGIQTFLQLYMRYELAPEYRQQVEIWLNDPENQKPKNKTPKHDDPPLKDPEGAYPNALKPQHICTKGVSLEKR